MPLLINGRYLTRPVTGVERYSDMLLQVVASEWPDARVAIPATYSASVDTHGLEVVRVGRSTGHVWEQTRLPSILDKNDVLLSPANSGPLRVRRQVVAIHDLAVIHHPDWFDRSFAAWYNFLLPRLARRVAGVITVSEHSKRDLQQTFELRPDRVKLVPPFAVHNGADTVKHGIHRPYYLMVASRDPRKGYDRAVAWYSRLERPPFQLVIVGRSGRAFNEVSTADVLDVVHLDDVNDDRLHALYAGAIALIQPSRAEGFGLPILEAMAHGCPVIASDLPVFRELFGDAILYADIGTDPSMHVAIAQVSDPIQRAEFIVSGHRKAIEFSFDRMAASLHQVLDPLLNT